MLMLTLQDEEAWPSSSVVQNGSAGSAHANGEAPCRPFKLQNALGTLKLFTLALLGSLGECSAMRKAYLAS